MAADTHVQNAVAAADRTLLILETLSVHTSINLEDLSRECALPKATVYRFLQTLCGRGYVFRDKHDLYSLTLKMFSIGSGSLEHMELPRAARESAEHLAKELGETVHMGIREEKQAIYILKIESRYTLRMYSRIGKSIPLYCTAIGKQFLADISPQDLDEYIKTTGLIPHTPYTITDGAKLTAEVQEIQKTGISYDREEHEDGIVCIGASVRDYTGSASAAISVSWPVFRFQSGQEKEYAALIRKTADSVSRILGYNGKG